MRRFPALIAALTLTAPAWADTVCTTYPASERLSLADARAKLEARGDPIHKFGLDHDCYEVQGRDQDGRRVKMRPTAKKADIG
jgi:hypothetical protein